MASSRVAKNKEQVAPNVEQLRGSQRSGSGGKDQPSKSVKEESWYKMTMQNAQAQEASRSMIKGKYSTKGLSETKGIAFVLEVATNHVDWKASMVADLIMKTKPPPGGRSTFLPKRECLCLSSIGQILPHVFVPNTWDSSLMPLRTLGNSLY
jgi:hypothetical protein